jgi:hypothetical protein
MNNRLTPFLTGTVAATVALLLGAAPAAAQLSSDTQKCRGSVAKAYSKAAATAAKTIAGCHKGRNGGKVLDTVDCNDITQADTKGKFAKAALKIGDAIVKSCTGQGPTLLHPDFYLSCPAPCGTDLGLPNPMTSLANVGSCLSCLAATYAEDVSATSLGSPMPAMLSKDDQKCHSAIAKGYQKALATAVKEQQGCQKGADKAGATTVASCTGVDPKGKVGKANDKAGAGVDKSCAAATLTNVDSCATDSLANVKSCNAAAYGPAGTELFTTGYELPSTLCPTTVRTTIRAGCSTNGDGPGCLSGNSTQSVLNVGWTGAAHDVDLLDMYSTTASVTCPGSEAGSCGDCVINGVDASDPQYSSFLRCSNNPSVACTTPFAPDAACGGNTCSYFLGAPLPVSAGGTPTCTINRMATDISGTADPDAGSSELNLDLRAVVHNGLSQAQPCPICQNDTTPQDGVKSGTCSGGLNDGLPCDVQGFDLSFSTANAVNPTSGTSLDCTLSAAANISGAGLVIDLPLTTGTVTLPFGDACDSPNESEDCACGVCVSAPEDGADGSVSCNGDSDCTSLNPNWTCGFGAGVARQPNQCVGYVCDPVMGQTDRGICNVDVTQQCSGLVRANGKGVLNCQMDSDCEALDSICPGGDCGTCNLFDNKSCFLNPIVVTGTPDTDNPILAGVFCLPPTSNSGVSSASGSPGPASVKVDALVELGY